MDNQIKVSVIVPVYNGEKRLKQCIESIQNQTLREIEIICVDDGSTDKTSEILKQLADGDKRIIVLKQENAGAGAARNNGMRVATGEYYSFLDADDFFEPNMLELAYAKITEEKSQVIVFNSDQYYEEEDLYKSVNWTIHKKALPPYRPMNHVSFCDNVFKVFVGWAWDKLFEAKFVKAHDLSFQEQRTSNDLLFVFSAIFLAPRISVIDQVLVHQRRELKDSLSKTREKSWDCFYHALKALKANLQKYNLYYSLEQDYINYCLHFSLWNLNTITGEKKEVMYHKLKNEWFKEFGIEDKPETYFFLKGEYDQYLKIKENSLGSV